MIQGLTSLEKILGYQFSDPALLEHALTHRSVATANNERMEFLGDAILSFVITVALYDRFPQLREGDLSRLRAYLVNGERLAEIARKLSLGQYLRLGSGELKSGGFERSSILADAFEAIIGAVYIDAGIEIAREFVLSFFTTYLDNCKPDETLKDPKTRLQEYLQSQGKSLPSYKVITIKGEAHDQQFTIECCFDPNMPASQANGSNRRKAEQSAAQQALTLLGQ